MSKEQLRSDMETFSARGLAVVSSYSLDAGMERDAFFPDDVSVSIDLQKLDLPELLWDDVTLYKRENGRLGRLVTRREGSTITCSIRHNEIITVVLVTLGLGLSGFAILNQVQKHGLSSLDWDNTDLFCIHWPVGLPPQTAEAARLSAELWKLFEQYTGVTKQAVETILRNGGFIEWLLLNKGFWKYRQDARVKEIQRTLGDVEWRRKNSWPVQAANTLQALERAYEYLTVERTFRKPSWVIDVYLRDPWNQKASVLGLSCDQAFTRPYLDVQLARVPKQLHPKGDDDYDELHTTLLHELFHIVSKYVYVDWQEYRWFYEAAAVTLEFEAKAYYARKGFVTTFKTTDRDPFWNFLGMAMDPKLWPPGYDEDDQQNHGYNASYFYQFLRERYYSKNPHDFLPALLADFATWRGGTVDSLKNTTSQDGDQFGKDFLDFVLQVDAPIIERLVAQKQRIEWGRPYHLWVNRSTVPLSAPVLELALDRYPDEALSEAQLFIDVSDSLKHKVTVRARPAAGNWCTLQQKETLLPASALTSPRVKLRGFYLQRVDTNTLGMGTLPLSVHAILLLKPSQPPVVKVDSDRLTVTWPRSALVPSRRFKEYRLQFEVNGKTLERSSSGERLDLSFGEIRSLLGVKEDPKKKLPVRVVVRYAEALVSESGACGPWSPMATANFNLDGPKPLWFLSKVEIEDSTPKDGSKGLQFEAVRGKLSARFAYADEHEYSLTSSWTEPPEQLAPGQSLQLQISIDRQWIKKPDQPVRAGFISVGCGDKSAAFENQGTHVWKVEVPGAYKLGERLLVRIDAVPNNYFWSNRRFRYVYVFGGKDIPEPQMPVGSNPYGNAR